MTPAFPHLFSPFELGGLRLKNRVVMAPMSTSLGGEDGAVTPDQIAFYRDRARGGFGLIVVEFTCVDPATGRTEVRQLSLDSRRNLDGHKRLVEMLHAEGAKAFLQLQHGGRFSPARFLPGGVTKGPSRVVSRKDPSKVVVEAFSAAEVERLVQAFATTAALAAEADYDGIELHGAHGYLLLQFMSPYGNTRDDAWGGDFERRLAFPLAVVRAIRQAIGGRTLCYRVSADEFVPGGLTIDDMEVIAPHLVAAGVDMLHASTGRGPEAFDKVMEPMSAPEGWRLPYARRLRLASDVPVIGVGQIRWPDTAEAALGAGDADLIALGRPSLTDPDWPNKAQAGQVDAIRPCTTCNWCISEAQLHRICCAENPRTGAELDPPIPADLGRGRHAVVVGAGPAGLSAALMLDAAGFRTELYEARGDIGGGLVASATPPGKDKIFWYRDYLRRRLSESRVKLKVGQRVEADALIAARPDVTILAAGTRPRALPIAGVDGPMVLDAFDVLMGDAPTGVEAGGRVVVYGGGETGCETAEFYAALGARVTLVTRSARAQLARSAEAVYRVGLVRRLNENPAVEIIELTHVVRVGEGRVEIAAADGEPRVIEADRLLLAQGRDPADGLAQALAAAGVACHVVGDNRKGGRIGDAVHASYQALKALAAAAT
jgi:2,4-dienoyl-CoA reductase (NADPH2)